MANFCQILFLFTNSCRLLKKIVKLFFLSQRCYFLIFFSSEEILVSAQANEKIEIAAWTFFSPTFVFD